MVFMPRLALDSVEQLRSKLLADFDDKIKGIRDLIDTDQFVPALRQCAHAWIEVQADRNAHQLQWSESLPRNISAQLAQLTEWMQSISTQWSAFEPIMTDLNSSFNKDIDFLKAAFQFLESGPSQSAQVFDTLNSRAASLRGQIDSLAPLLEQTRKRALDSIAHTELSCNTELQEQLAQSIAPSDVSSFKLDIDDLCESQVSQTVF
jgi:uncharacterized membrane protein YdfJ with MMPL/SSD domain